MNGNWLKILVAIAAILIAGSAAYFSVTGLGVLFSGAAIAVMVMASSLEFAKLVTATYLKQKWDTIHGFNKWYLASAVTILMLITSAGIFGYLSNAFQQQNLKLQQVQREVDVWNNKIKLTNDQIATLQSQQKDLSNTQNTLITKGNVNSRLIRSADNRDKQSTKISNKINTLQDSIVAYNGKINEIKNNNIEIEKEVGGFRFVAEAFGVELNSVVKFFIILIVVVFDPLAIALIIAFNQLMMTKKEDEEDEEKPKPQSPEHLQDFVGETSRLRLSESDLKKLEEVLLNPPKPNEELIKAAEEYKRRGEMLDEMMKNDQELGLYDEPFDNPLIKEDNEDISDWDVTLMDGLEDEEPFFIEDELVLKPNYDFPTTPTEEEKTQLQKLQDYVNPPIDVVEDDELEFSDEFISEAIDEFNREQLEEEFDMVEPTVDVVQINSTLEEVNKELDNTSSEQDDEKKNYNQ
jgi:hypothetical protein